MVPCRFCVALLAACVATAVTAEPVAHEDPVRLYTNADLEELAPLPVAASPDAQVENTEWDFVEDFISREHERLQSERSHELDRRRVEIAQEPFVDRRYYGYPAVYAHPYSGRTRNTTSGPGGHIVPLHARPSPARMQRSRAIKRSGRDAFPSRSGPSH